MNKEIDYKNKYIKYKNKYLSLKQSIDKSNLDGGFGLSNVMGLAKMGMNMGMGLGQNMIPKEQQQLINQLQHFITPQNTKLLGALVTSLLSHVLDPRYYFIVGSVVKDIMMLVASAGTANPLAVMFSLNNALFQLKSSFPKEFKLLKKFFYSNRSKIIPILQSYYPNIINDSNYKFIIDFIFT